MARRTKVQSESEFLAERGLSSPISGFADDKMRSNRQIRTSRGAKAFQKAAQRASSDYHTQRESARAEYRSRVQSGAVRPPSSVEKALKTAQGNSDNEAVRAARRILAKRGIDWKPASDSLGGKWRPVHLAPDFSMEVVVMRPRYVQGEFDFSRAAGSARASRSSGS